jgi:hypothetical protein
MGPFIYPPATQIHQEEIMNILKKPDQAFVPVNQPTNFPRFYLIPETSTLQTPKPASNSPIYHQSPPSHIKATQETKIQKFIRHEKEIFREVCIDAWTAIKQAGRAAVHWLARWVVLPLSVASTFWISIGNPAELPL